MVPGLHSAFYFLRACLCRGVGVGKEILLEFELLCPEFIPKKLRRLLVLGGEFRNGLVTLLSGSFARCFYGGLKELGR